MFDALISAGANLLGGWLNRNAQEKFNEQQLAFGREQLDFQKQAAMHGVSWKVADSVAAGLHPLAGLGAQTFSPSPVSVGGEAPKYDFSSLGQDLSRAAKAVQEDAVREKVDEAQARSIALEKGRLENDILRSDLASRLNRSSQSGGQLGPPLPSGSTVPIPRPGPSRSASGFAIGDDEMKAKDESAPGVRRLPLWGVLPINSYPGRATGQDLENEYGEYGGGLMAIPNIATDLVYTYGPSGGFKMFGGSGYSAKRFRRGRYTAPSYRPWAE